MATATNDFHASDTQYVRYTENAIKAALEENRITTGDAALIKEFTSEVMATSRVSQGRRYKLTYVLIGWRRFIDRPFGEVAIGDVYAGVEAMRTSCKDDGTPEYAQNSIGNNLRILKQFCKWLVENEYSGMSMAKIDKIKPPRYESKVSAGDLLTPEEVRLMIESCRNSRDRAMIAVIYEGALRIGEVGTLTWGALEFTDWNATLSINFKTGFNRRIPLVMSREFLAAWKADYPDQITPDAPVFLNRWGRPFKYGGLAKRIQTIAERAGVQKKFHAHIIRHSRITHLLQQGLHESIIKKLAWGNSGTSMIEIYGHLSDSDVDDAIAAMAGVKPPAAKEAAECLEPKQCPRCYTIAGPTTNFCPKCGLGLTLKAVEDVKVAEQQAELTPEFQALYDKIMRDLRAELP